MYDCVVLSAKVCVKVRVVGALTLGKTYATSDFHVVPSLCSVSSRVVVELPSYSPSMVREFLRFPIFTLTAVTSIGTFSIVTSTAATAWAINNDNSASSSIFFCVFPSITG